MQAAGSPGSSVVGQRRGFRNQVNYRLDLLAVDRHPAIAQIVVGRKTCVVSLGQIANRSG